MERRSRRRWFAALVLVAALAAGLVAGLAVAAAEEATPAAGQDGSPLIAPPDSASPGGGGKVVYKVGWLDDVDNMNPFIGYLWTSFEIWYLTYDCLVGYDPVTFEPVKGVDSPGLATDWTVSDDGLTWTFTIRKGVKWHDGTPLTARDVAFTYNYVIDNDLENFTSYLEGIRRAVALDDTHVRFVCSRPKPDMIRHWLPILPEHIWSKVDPKKAARGYGNLPPYVGSGPFQCVEWKKDSIVRLVANKDYWRGAPRIDELWFVYYTNADTMVQDLIAGSIDGCAGMLPAQMKQLGNVPGIKARAIYVNGFDELGFNCYRDGPSKGNPVLRDWRFRQALNWAIDLDKVVSIGYGGYARPGTTVIPPDYYKNPDWHWEPPADVKYTYDPGTAKQKLDEAGYRDTDGDGWREYNGKPIKLRLFTRSESVASQKNGRLIAGWLEDVGIDVVMSTMDDGALTDKMYNYEGDTFVPDYDMFIWGWYLDYDPGSMLSYFTKDQIENWSDCAWWDPEYERLYRQQSRELDPLKRKQFIDRMQQILYEQSPYIVLAYSEDLEAFNTARWDGYIAIPAPNGNVLFPPYGNCGHENFLRIGPRAGAGEEQGSSLGLWVAVGVAAVAAVVVVALVLRARRPRAVEQ